MNQNKYIRLTNTLKQCGIKDADKLVGEFKQFMKYQKLNKDIDNMIDKAHEKKISDEEFKAMIDEQKQIMKDLAIRNINFKEPPSSIQKPKLNVKNNSNNKNVTSSNNISKKQAPVIQVFNITDIKNYEIKNNQYIFYGPNNKVVESIRLKSGKVKKVSELSNNQLEDISESVGNTVNTEIYQPLDPQNKKNTLKVTPKPNPMLIPSKPKKKSKKSPPKPKKKTPSKPKKKSPPKPKKKPIKKKPPRKKSKTNSKNQYWYHQLPDYPIKNISKVKGKRRRIIKTPIKPKKTLVTESSKVPFKGFFDMLKI